MKILTDIVSAGAEQQNTGMNRQTTGKEFDNILQQEIATSAKPAESTMTLPPVQNIPTILFDQIQNGTTSQSVAQVDEFLNLLDAYQNKLGDTGSTLKNFSSLVSSIESETEKIIPLLDSIPEGDGLKDILNRALVTATVETIKFNRGDYL